MKGYVYIENGRVVVNEEKRPEPTGFEDDPYLFYLGSLSIWKKKSIEVENVKKIEYKTHTVHYYTHDKGMTEIISGEKYEFKKHKDKIIIIDYA